eukprot:TRINITY_DN4322_c0_g1_i3.p1 TRINITY_DN4322_c0_g1~~TRINITY_DN4322_c0_g1_i3.p1  ORF type:complete len:345 (-),score=25.68 TRINITY_DN4322_c0_g1_i3:221-1255(-)
MTEGEIFTTSVISQILISSNALKLFHEIMSTLNEQNKVLDEFTFIQSLGFDCGSQEKIRLVKDFIKRVSKWMDIEDREFQMVAHIMWDNRQRVADSLRIHYIRYILLTDGEQRTLSEIRVVNYSGWIKEIVVSDNRSSGPKGIRICLDCRTFPDDVRTSGEVGEPEVQHLTRNVPQPLSAAVPMPDNENREEIKAKFVPPYYEGDKTLTSDTGRNTTITTAQDSTCPLNKLAFSRELYHFPDHESKYYQLIGDSAAMCRPEEAPESNELVCVRCYDGFHPGLCDKEVKEKNLRRQFEIAARLHGLTESMEKHVATCRKCGVHVFKFPEQKVLTCFVCLRDPNEE